jgi:hypothetical protein
MNLCDRISYTKKYIWREIMKKISLILALLLCLMPVLTACGGGGAEKAVKKYLDAKYKDFESEVFEEVVLNYNKDILKKNFTTEEFQKYVGTDDAFKKRLNELDEQLDDNRKAAEKEWDKYKVSYKIDFCEVYEEDDERFDFYKEYKLDARYTKTDFKKEITAIAVVGVTGKISYVDDEMKFVKPIGEELVCVCIEDEWYIIGVHVSAYTTVEELEEAAKNAAKENK